MPLYHQTRASGRADVNLPEDRSIVLVGLMGAGKSSIGRRLAAHLDLPFLDADSEIERAAGCSIPEIFARFGETAFREGERRVIRRLLDGPRCVLATGGGAFMDAETRAAVRDRGISVWLRAELDVLVRRTAGRDDRPLLHDGDPREILGRLIEERYPVYRQADLIVDSGDEPTEAVLRRVLAALAARYPNPVRNEGGAAVKAGPGVKAGPVVKGRTDER